MLTSRLKYATLLLAMLSLPAQAAQESWAQVIQQEAKRAGFGHWRIVYAYCQLESGLDDRQDYSAGGMRALGACSVQRDSYPQFSVGQLKARRLNVYLTALEFKARWTGEPLTTAREVFLPAWGRKFEGPRGGYPSSRAYVARIRGYLLRLRP